MAERRHPHVANLSELDSRNLSMGTKFGATMKHLGQATAGKQLGCSWYEVPPGRTAFPRHFHCVNEESLFILEGEGSLRIGEATVPVGPGDYVSFPVGPETVHQLWNSGSGPLRYLCLSTVSTGEVVGYPDAKKVGAMAAPSREAAQKGEHWVRMLALESNMVGYYDGEDVG